MSRRCDLITALALASVGVFGGAATGAEREALDDLLLMVRILEAPRGYDDYFRGVAASPPQALTTMSIDGVLAWQDAIDPRSPSEAAGGYMIMEDTLRQLHIDAGIAGTAVFDRATQDRLGEHLARDAGWGAFERGEVSALQFGNQLASVWAALPLLSGPSRGKSRYHGVAGNKALIGADRFEHILNNLGSIDVAAELAAGGTAVVAGVVPPRATEPVNGFKPSRLVRWTTDPFYQE